VREGPDETPPIVDRTTLHRVLAYALEVVAGGLAATYERTFVDGWPAICERCVALDWIEPDQVTALRRALLHRSLDLTSLVVPLFLDDPRLPRDGKRFAHRLRTYRNDLIHRKVDDDGVEFWADPRRIEDALDAADGLLAELGADEARYEFRYPRACVRRLLEGRPLAQYDGLRPPPPPIARGESGAGEESRFFLSPDQREALERIEAWFRDPTRREFVLAGPAGSGKTTLIREAIDQLQLTPYELRIATPTSKAREVLRRKLRPSYAGCCQTIASLLWKFRPDPNDPDAGEDLRFRRAGPKPPIQGLRLVIVDEASMLTARDRDRLGADYRTLYVGDPHQLPPVIEAGEAEEDARVLERPDATLTVVHRHGDRGDILRAAGQARSGEQLAFAGFASEDGVRILDEEDGAITPERFRILLREHDVILTGRNRTRIVVNGIVRRLCGRAAYPGDHDPKPGDLLVCTANQQLSDGTRIENGERIEVLEVHGRVKVRRDRDDIEDLDIVGLVEGRDEPPKRLTISSQMLAGLHLGGGGGRENTREVSGPRSGVVRCEWGYALTVHKAQGSEWDRVLVLEDARRDERMDRRRWDYTAFTRARSQLTVLRLATPSRLLADWHL